MELLNGINNLEYRDTPISSLSPEGENQAQTLARQLAIRFCSDLCFRSECGQKRTAEIMAQSFSLQVQTTPQLRERSWGEWEGKNIEELRTNHGYILGTVVRSENPEILEPVKLPGIAIVETYTQALARVIPFP